MRTVSTASGRGRAAPHRCARCNYGLDLTSVCAGSRCLTSSTRDIRRVPEAAAATRWENGVRRSDADQNAPEADQTVPSVGLTLVEEAWHAPPSFTSTRGDRGRVPRQYCPSVAVYTVPRRRCLPSRRVCLLHIPACDPPASLRWRPHLRLQAAGEAFIYPFLRTRAERRRLLSSPAESGRCIRRGSCAGSPGGTSRRCTRWRPARSTS